MKVDDKIKYLFYLFATGVGDGLFFIGVGKMLSVKLQLFFGVSLLFILNEVSKLLFQFIFTTVDKKFSMKKAIVISEIVQTLFLIGIVLFNLDIFSTKILVLSLVVLNFFEGLSKVAEFNLTLKIFRAEERKKYNSIITTINQTSKILGFMIGGFIIYKEFYKLLFLLNAISFIVSALFALKMEVKDEEIMVNSSWKEVLRKGNFEVILYTFIIASNTVILSSNSILGFNLSVQNVKETILYQISGALGSTVATAILIRSLKKINKEKIENKIIILSLGVQGFLFLLFNLVNGYNRIGIFILISIISFINLSLYITKLQDFADKGLGSKVYSLRQLNRSIFNAIGVTGLTIVASSLKIEYQNVISIFCFTVMSLNIFLIKNRKLTYIPEK